MHWVPQDPLKVASGMVSRTNAGEHVGRCVDRQRLPGHPAWGDSQGRRIRDRLSSASGSAVSVLGVAAESPIIW